VPVAALVVLIALLLGCSQAASPRPLTPTPSATPTVKTERYAEPVGDRASGFTTASPSPTALKPKYGGFVNYPLLAYPGGFDVHMKTSYTPFVALPVFSYLVRL